MRTRVSVCNSNKKKNTEDFISNENKSLKNGRLADRFRSSFNGVKSRIIANKNIILDLALLSKDRNRLASPPFF